MSELTILGGGPAGVGLAYYAHRSGLPFVLYEKSQELGGMCRTFRHGEHRWDAGAHRFHDRDPEVTDDVRSLLGADLRPVCAPSQVWTRGRFVDFPPTPLNAALSYGAFGAARIGLELLKTQSRPRAAANFQDFADNRFGPTLARELLVNYSQKLWGLPAGQLSPDVATRRLHGMTLRSLFMELVSPGRKTAHIDGRFLYPRLGYGQIIERLSACLSKDSLRTGREISGIEVEGGKVRKLYFRDGTREETPGRVVSTLPVTFLVKLLGDALPAAAREAAERLCFRQIRLVFLRLDQERVSPNASIYIPETRYCVSRVSEPKNRSSDAAPAGETALVAEVPCFSGDALDRLPAAALAARVVDELSQIGLLRSERVREWRHVLLPNAYPVYAVGYEREMRTIRAALSSISNLDTMGRAGAFHYSHLHEQLRFGKDYVATLGKRSRPALETA
ncbi:MAG: FAD-dependent oxidoreductase [Elusimicrobia bacterium]|nr:FAD-dependent oxidoreductase [Elusimicrobiota bacterium]